MDWLVFTSRNAVDAFRDVLQREGRDIGIFRATRVAAIGPGTAEAVRRHGLPIALQPEEQVAEGLLEALAAREGGRLDGRHVLLPRGDRARPALRDGLRALGATVTDLVVYETVAPEIAGEAVDALVAFEPDIVVFTSSSTCAHFCDRLRTGQLELLKAHAAFAAIGPITARTARARGLDTAIIPATYDLAHLTDAIVAHVSGERGGP